jgi:DNA polymerase (family 10)
LSNVAIALILREIADLLEIKGDNPFKIRAYRNAADIVGNHPHALAVLDAAQLREIPGIGKDLAVRIRDIATTGDTAVHRELIAEFPARILDLLGLQGVGPKTVAVFYRDLGVRSLADLERAAADGRIRALKGMGAKKEALILKALEERRRRTGRLLLSDADAIATSLIAYLQDAVPGAGLTPVGSLRRGRDTCGDLDLLATDGDASLMDAFVRAPRVERVLARGETKSSVLFDRAFQADLRLVPAESRGAALQYFTGSKAHNIALRDRAVGFDCKLNEYGLFRLSDEARLAGESEEAVYRSLGLDWIAPELREGRGEIEAAATGRLPRLIQRSDLKGDLHMHTSETDGSDDIRAMATAARESGLDYIAITDHSQALAMANGLNEERALAHASRIRAVDRDGGIRVLAGIECDIKPDGTLDLADDCLAALDYVVASVHSAFNQDQRQMTDRLVRAIACPYVDVIGHPTGRLLLRRDPYPVDMEALVDAAVKHGVALEINAQPHRLDLNDAHAILARERGASLVISSDAHSRTGLAALRWGVAVARRAWLEPAHVLNSRPFEDFKAALRRNRQ